MFRILAFTLVTALIAPAAWAGGPNPFPEFSAKRVTPPKKGAKRITVQIDPVARAAAAAKVETGPAVAASPTGAIAPLNAGQFDWFWDKVSPAADRGGAGRLAPAMAALSTGKVPAPRLQNLQDIARSNGIDILRATVGTKVSPALVLAVISVESAGRTDAVSRAGAAGLMQLMPDTAARFGVQNSMIAAENISGGVKYLDWLMGEFDRDPILVLAGYNAGEGSVRKHAGVPPFAETRDYVPKVLAAFQVAQGLCLTPPELISDGCVFAALN
ncbi:lytic transglycosylase domain-containing protein [Sulfitobacter sp. W027]|uniref:lytic transglycosylase domain-containing protein n=1 Tax=Sulfitobacter sp. W027 TaxID=2867025 RepID=UPI0021A39600|nr:lytic transglycosylase domain-containing protein [Sulfitobacter sp. W027]UWR34302.1 lytic transglycosylase domain-containing protein [Sulfitobacter sp. W027]